MKRVITFILAFTLAASAAFALSGCSLPPDLASVKSDLVALIDASFEVNDILFGAGLMTEYDLSGLKDDYSASIKNYENYYSDDEIYQNIYSPVVASYKDASGNEVKQFTSIAEIKAAAEKVYSEEFLRKVYVQAFSGTSDESDGYYHSIKPRYREDDDVIGVDAKGNDVTQTVLRKYRYIEENGMNYVDGGHDRTLYDVETMKIVSPSNASTLMVEISARYQDYEIVMEDGDYDHWTSKPVGYSWHTVKLCFVLQNGSWRLDSATY